MRHNNDHRKLGRTAAHRKAMLGNMVTSLFERERIQTTAAKAKEARRLAERMITFARKGDLAARRHVARTVKDPAILKKLFDDIAPRYAKRPGGYTRILKLGFRKGDAADTAILELVGKDDKPRGKKKHPRKTYHKVEVPESPVIAAKKAAEKAAKKAEAEAKAAEEAAKKAEEEAAAAEEETGAEEPAAEEAAAEEKADKQAEEAAEETPAEEASSEEEKK
jgi:large subunit ribosomal protein L17